MGAEVLAWLGLIGVLLTAVHWALDAARQRGQRLPPLLAGLLRGLERIPTLLSAHDRAERRRADRVRLARQHRDAMARNDSQPALDDEQSAPAVEWDGNVARPQFGRERRKQRPHNLH
jgi:Tfp pilus assembly protein PilN